MGDSYEYNGLWHLFQVHNRSEYLYHLVNSLRSARDIEQALLIFSHDVYSDELNNIVKSVDFCPVSMLICLVHSLMMMMAIVKICRVTSVTAYKCMVFKKNVKKYMYYIGIVSISRYYDIDCKFPWLQYRSHSTPNDIVKQISVPCNSSRKRSGPSVRAVI